MPDVLVKLHRFMEQADADNVAEAIREDGEVRYTALTGEQLAAKVAEVVVRDA